MTAADDASRAASEARYSVSTAVLRLAEASGAEVREEPFWPGAHSTARHAEPLAGIRAAVTVRNYAEQVTADYITRARGDGVSWLEIGRALGFEDGDREPYDIAVAAYERAAGEATLSWQADFRFTCGTCGQRITDRGPYEAAPYNCEEGHADGCSRMAEAVRAYQAQWDDDGETGEGQ